MNFWEPPVWDSTEGTITGDISKKMLSVVLSFLALMHKDRQIGIDKPSEK